MTTWVPHLNLGFGGTYYGSEIWQCTIKFAQPASVGTLYTDAERIAFTQDHLADVVTDVATFWGGSNSGINRNATLHWLKFNAIDSAGKYADHINTVEHEYTSPVVPAFFPGVTANGLPQTALALSLVTGARRGPAAHGRIYVPVQELAMSGVHVDPAHLGPITEHFSEFVTDLNNWPGLDDPGIPVVSVVGAPIKEGPKARDGQAREVIGVRVGDVLDTQRRRRGKFVEAYTEHSI